METAAVHGSGQDLKQLPGIKTALARQSEDFAEDLQTGCAHGIAGKFDEIGGGRIASHKEDLLTERIEYWQAAANVAQRTCRDDEQLTSFRGIRIPEDWRRNITLRITRVLGCEPGCRHRADSAHRKMDRARQH